MGNWLVASPCITPERMNVPPQLLSGLGFALRWIPDGGSWGTNTNRFQAHGGGLRRRIATICVVLKTRRCQSRMLTWTLYMVRKACAAFMLWLIYARCETTNAFDWFGCYSTQPCSVAFTKQSDKSQGNSIFPGKLHILGIVVPKMSIPATFCIPPPKSLRHCSSKVGALSGWWRDASSYTAKRHSSYDWSSQSKSPSVTYTRLAYSCRRLLFRHRHRLIWPSSRPSKRWTQNERVDADHWRREPIEDYRPFWSTPVESDHAMTRAHFRFCLDWINHKVRDNKMLRIPANLGSRSKKPRTHANAGPNAKRQKSQ